jgi:hypothetical protein
LEAFQRLVVGRELDMLELKEEINALSQELRKPIPYPEVKEIRERGRRK